MGAASEALRSAVEQGTISRLRPLKAAVDTALLLGASRLNRTLYAFFASTRGGFGGLEGSIFS